ncbi:hypothetical protein AB0876_19320 [Mycobacterium sp. NPDC049093]
MVGDEIDINEAIALYLKHYPGRNDAEFALYFGSAAAGVAKGSVRALLDEAMSIQPDWNSMDLNEAGDYVESVMQDHHPELSRKSLDCIGNYFTYLMR